MRWHNLFVATYAYLATSGNVASALPQHCPFEDAQPQHLEGGAPRKVSSGSDVKPCTDLIPLESEILEERGGFSVAEIMPNLSDFLSWVAAAGQLGACGLGTAALAGAAERKFLNSRHVHDWLLCFATKVVRLFPPDSGPATTPPEEIVEQMERGAVGGIEAVRLVAEGIGVLSGHVPDFHHDAGGSGEGSGNSGSGAGGSGGQPGGEGETASAGPSSSPTATGSPSSTAAEDFTRSTAGSVKREERRWLLDEED